MWFLLPLLLLLLPFTAERYGLVCCSLFHSTKVWWFWLYSRNKRKKDEGEQQKNKIIENYFDIAMRNNFFLFFISSLGLVDKSNKMQKLHEDILRHYFLLYSKSCCCCYTASFFRVHCLNDRSFASQPLVV